MTHKLDYRDVQREQDASARYDLAVNQLKQFAPDEPPSLSDIYANLNKGGQTFLIALEEQEKQNMRPGGKPFLWKILVRKDEWGNVPKPGDTIKRVIPINRKNRDKQPVSPREMSAAKVDGSFAERFEQRIEYPVDDKGCIECSFSDAGYFLFNWGVHHKTNRGMTGKPEYSREPCKCPAGGELHVHYWRYSEPDKHEYSQLSKRKVTTEKRRGTE